jgi:hypothetical protein
MASASATLKQKLYRGFKEYMVITLYLWVIFVLFDVYRSVLVAQYHISLAAKGFAVINAMALAKIALIAREFKLDERLRPKGRPLIYPTLLNAAAFAGLMALFKLVEEVGVGMYHHDTVAQSVAKIGGSWKGLLCLAVIFFVMLIPFCAFAELGLALGEGKLARIFLYEHRVRE